jgi:two-component system KDP operon response regulator KdpE
MNTVLIIDDETQIRRLLRLLLESRNFRVLEAASGAEGLSQAAFGQPHAVLLDLGLPDMEGLEVLHRLREWTDVPILVISVREQEAIKIRALESGADDYVTKPFGTGELLARLAAVQRRGFVRQSALIQAGPLTLDLLHHEVRLAEESLRLTPLEFNVLKTLAENYGRIVTQNQLLAKVWPEQPSTPSEVLRVHIARIRKKLGSGPLSIINEPGIGYRLENNAGPEVFPGDQGDA